MGTDARPPQERGWLRSLYPRPEEIQALARREVDPREYARFEPIARGPLFALLALAAVGLAALPGCAARLLEWLRARRGVPGPAEGGRSSGAEG